MTSSSGNDAKIAYWISIDFGSYGFGCAYCPAGKPQTFTLIDGWPGMDRRETSQRSKNISALSLDKNNKNIIYYGYQCIYNDHNIKQMKDENYSDNDDSDDDSDDSDDSDDNKDAKQNEEIKMPENDNMVIIKNFKPHINQDESSPYFRRDRLIHGILITDLICKLLSKITQHCLLKLNSKTQEITLTQDNILWIISYPCIWDIKSVELLQQCMNNIGLKNIFTIQEPHAAFYYCINQLMDNKEFDIKYKPQSKDIYIIMDCGGYTTDCAVIQIENNISELKEIISSDAIEIGGLYLQNNFINILKKILGNDFIDNFEKNKPFSWNIQLMKYLEAIHNAKHDDISINIELHETFRDAITKLLPNDKDRKKKFSSFTIGEHKKLIRFERSYIVIEQILIHELFTFVDEITKFLQTKIALIINQLKLKLNKIILVGGCAESQIIKYKLEESCKKLGYELIRPSRAQSAIIYGALYSPNMKMKYIAKKTIGIQVTGEWKKGDPDDYKRPCFNYKSLYMRTDLFYPLIKKTEMFENQKIVTTSQFGIQQNGTSVKIEFWTPKDELDIPCSIISCVPIQSFIIKISKPAPKYTIIKVDFIFQPNSIQLIVRDPFIKTQYENKITIECLQEK